MLSGSSNRPNIEVNSENSYTIRYAREADIREYISEVIYSITGSRSRLLVNNILRFT